jgi:hypothetical protein
MNRDSCSLQSGLACLGLPFYVKPDSSGNTFCLTELVEGQKIVANGGTAATEELLQMLFK